MRPDWPFDALLALLLELEKKRLIGDSGVERNWGRVMRGDRKRPF